MVQSYIEELIILIIVGTILLIAKIIACCFHLASIRNIKPLT